MGEWNDYYRVIEEIDNNDPEPSDTAVETTIFVHSNWTDDPQNRRSTSGIVALINNAPYRWLANRL